VVSPVTRVAETNWQARAGRLVRKGDFCSDLNVTPSVTCKAAIGAVDYNYRASSFLEVHDVT